MNIIEELRARAQDMRDEGIGGWADTCVAAADRIAELEKVNSDIIDINDAHNKRIAELEAQRIQARYALEKCRMWNGSGYDWHPTHAKRAWEILGGGEK